ncbi:MAG TPA: DUF4129 domain-containing protein [Candidatus Dormibacteraeota bacterium]|nr:DUF4129 domain-containing protein [Candidatus Dormibacteraeota bacterium]
MRARLAAGAVLLALLAAVAPGPARAAATDATDYLRVVDSARADLEASPPDLAAARDAITAAQRLAPPPGGALAAVVSDLSRRPPDVADAVTRLRAIGDVLALPAGAAPGDAGDARRRLEGVYREPAFAHLDRVPSPSLLSRLYDGLRRLLGGLTRALGPAGSLLAGGLVLLAAIALTLRLLRGAAGRRMRGPPEERPAGGDDPEREWTAALTAAAAGDHREAIRRAFRSALLTVAARGRLPVDPSWTTRELLARAAGDADLVAALAPAAAAFDRAWYSGTAVGEADWLVARDRCAAVRRLASTHRAAA